MKKTVSFIFKVFIAIAMFSCSSNGSIVENQQVIDGFEFSAAPIDLKGIDANFVKDIAYDNKERTKFDVFLPNSEAPTPLVIFIHGGGFKSGDKSKPYTATSNVDYPEELRMFLSNNIAFATINYSFLENFGVEKEGVLKCLKDSKRALQYIRSRAKDFNIDKNKIVLTGGSAGAGTSLWLATSDDMRDINNIDPVLRESTRVKAIALRQTQSSYNLEDKWVNDVFVDYSITWSDLLKVGGQDIAQFYGVSSLVEYNTPEIDTYRMKIDMLSLMTSDDPAIWAENIQTPVVAPVLNSVANHHAYHVREIKEKADALGIENVCYYGKDPLIYSDPSEETLVSFIIRKLNN